MGCRGRDSAHHPAPGPCSPGGEGGVVGVAQDLVRVSDAHLALEQQFKGQRLISRGLVSYGPSRPRPAGAHSPAGAPGPQFLTPAPPPLPLSVISQSVVHVKAEAANLPHRQAAVDKNPGEGRMSGSAPPNSKGQGFPGPECV